MSRPPKATARLTGVSTTPDFLQKKMEDLVPMMDAISAEQNGTLVAVEAPLAVAEPVPEVVAPPVVEEVAPLPVPEQPETPVQPNETQQQLTTIQQAYKTQEGRLRVEREKNMAMQGDALELKQKMAELEHTVRELSTGQGTPEATGFDQLTEEEREMMPEGFENIMLKMIQSQTDPLKHENDTLRNNHFQNDLLRILPTYESITGTEDFAAWANTPDAVTGISPVDIMMTAEDEQNAQRYANMIGQYRAIPIQNPLESQVMPPLSSTVEMPVADVKAPEPRVTIEMLTDLAAATAKAAGTPQFDTLNSQYQGMQTLLEKQLQEGAMSVAL